MADLLIKDAELKQLDSLLGEIPTKYGTQIVNFINYVFQQRQQEAQPALVPLRTDAQVAGDAS